MVAEAALEAGVALSDVSRRDTFLRLISEYESALRRLAGAYADAPSDRDDLFQEIAVAVWRAIPRFRGESSERTWLYRIAHNVAISSVARAERREGKESLMPEEFEHPSPALNAEQEILRAERVRLLNQAIRELSITDRQIILLHLEGLGYAEIEQVSGLSESAIATRLSRIRERLREKIAIRRPTADEQS